MKTRIVRDRKVGCGYTLMCAPSIAMLNRQRIYSSWFAYRHEAAAYLAERESK